MASFVFTAALMSATAHLTPSTSACKPRATCCQGAVRNITCQAQITAAGGKRAASTTAKGFGGSRPVLFTDASQESTTGRLVTVHFQTHYQAAFGDSIVLVGSHPLLGSWDVRSALPLRWSEGDVWRGSLSVPEGSGFDYKLVHVSGEAWNWEQGEDRPFVAAQTGEEVQAGHEQLAEIDISCIWNNWAPSFVSYTTANADAAAAAAAPPSTDAAAAADAFGGSVAAFGDSFAHAMESAVGFLAGSGAGDSVDDSSEAAMPAAKAAAAAAAVEQASSQEGGAVLQLEAAAASLDVETVTLDLTESENAEVAALPKKNKFLGMSKGMSKTVGYAAVGIAGAVAMSVLAIDVTDIAVTSALLAGAAALMPGTSTSKSLKEKGAAAPAIAVLAAGLDAVETLNKQLNLSGTASKTGKTSSAGASSMPLPQDTTLEDTIANVQAFQEAADKEEEAEA